MKNTEILVILLLLLGTFNSNGQITNSTSKNESNIYFHAVDTLISLVKSEFEPTKILVESDKFILDRLPDSFSNQEIIKIYKKKLFQKQDGIIQIGIDRLNIDENKITIHLIVLKKVNGHWINWEKGCGGYWLYYSFDEKLKSYQLVDIDKLIITT